MLKGFAIFATILTLIGLNDLLLTRGRRKPSLRSAEQSSFRFQIELFGYLLPWSAAAAVTLWVAYALSA